MILEEQGERLHEETIPIKAAEIQTERKTRVIKMSGISGDWYEALKGEFSKPYYRTLFQTVNEEYRTRLIFPPAEDIFNAFHLTPLKKVKVVILGQDPYHNNGQAHGLCFSVKKANSHRGIGWEEFTDAAIMALNGQDRPIVFILWGAPAQRKKAMLNNPKHLILTAPHPSPLSAYRGFFGSRPFSKTNEFLESQGEEPIDWQIE